jgi:uncharacterized protein YkwD
MRRPARLLATAAAAAAPVLGVLGVAAPQAVTTPAAATERTVEGVRLNGYEAALAARINDARRNAGLRALVVVPGATDVARRWAWQLGHDRSLSHNPNLARDLGRSGSAAWTEIAENVGEASSTDPASLFQAYMASPPHRANILDRHARFLGVGVVERDGVAWNTLDFTNAYSTAYGRTRVPAAGLTMDRQRITSTTDVASVERPDQRFGTRRDGRVSAGLVHYTGPSSGNDSAYAVLVRHGRTGHGDLVMHDALDLSRAHTLKLQLRTSNPRGHALYVHVKLARDFARSVSLGWVRATPTRRWFSLPLPSAARAFRNAIVLQVSSSGLATVGGRARLAVLDIRAGV